MALKNPLPELSSVTEIEIQSYKANEIALLKLVGQGFSTICCRTAESHDLVVRDFSTGQIKFCISGAELSCHLITAYYTPDDTIGEISGGNTVTCESGLCFKITRNRQQEYKLNKSSIHTTDTRFLVTFKAGSTTSERVMILTFAIHLALFNNSILKKTLKLDDFNLGDDVQTSSAAVLPTKSKQKLVEIFAQTPVNEKFYIMHIGRISKDDHVLGLLDSSRRHNVILFACLRAEEKKISLVDINGNIICTGQSFKDDDITIVQESTRIGKILNFSNSKNIILTTSEGETQKRFNVAAELTYRIKAMIKNLNGGQMMKCDSDYPPVLRVTMLAQMTEIQILVFITWMFRVYTNANQYAQKNCFMIVSSLKCDCEDCLEPSKAVSNTQKPWQRMHVLNLLSKYLPIRLTAVGHNSSQNVVYINTYIQAAYTHVTLECTPVQNFYGMARLVAKDKFGSTLFYAVPYPQDIAVYDQQKKLLVYETRGAILDKDDNLIFNISKFPPYSKHPMSTENVWGKNEGYKVTLPSSSKPIIEVVPSYCSVEIRHCKKSDRKEFSLVQSIVLLTVAAKLLCNLYSKEVQITPEIAYRYNSMINDATFHQELCPVQTST